MIFGKPIVSEKDDDYVVEANFQRMKKICLWEMNSFNEHKAEKDDCPICHGDRWIAEVLVIKDKKAGIQIVIQLLKGAVVFLNIILMRGFESENYTIWKTYY